MTVLVWFIAASIICTVGFIVGAGVASGSSDDTVTGLLRRVAAAERDRDAEQARSEFLSAENALLRATIDRHNLET